MKFDLANKDHLEIIKKKITFACKKYHPRSSKQEIEDCFSETITRMLSGRGEHQTFDQMVLDYLREKVNLKGFGRNFKNQPHVTEFDTIHDRAIESNQLTSNDKLDLKKLFEYCQHWERAVVMLYYLEGYGMKEIGYLFGVTESRISQWLNKFQSDAIKLVNNPLSNRWNRRVAKAITDSAETSS